MKKYFSVKINAVLYAETSSTECSGSSCGRAVVTCSAVLTGWHSLPRGRTGRRPRTVPGKETACESDHSKPKGHVIEI